MWAPLLSAVIGAAGLNTTSPQQTRSSRRRPGPRQALVAVRDLADMADAAGIAFETTNLTNLTNGPSRSTAVQRPVRVVREVRGQKERRQRRAPLPQADAPLQHLPAWIPAFAG